MTTQPSDVLLAALDELPAELAQRTAILSADDARDLRARATRAFTDGTTPSVRTDARVGDAQVTCEDSWKLVEEFDAAGPVVLFTNRRDGETMVELPSIGEAIAAIGRMPRFDFYLVDRACTYLFAADEYETLFGCGTAAAYVSKL